MDNLPFIWGLYAATSGSMLLWRRVLVAVLVFVSGPANGSSKCSRDPSLQIMPRGRKVYGL